MIRLLTLIAAFAASPAAAAGFSISLRNTDFVVLLAFLLAGLLDKRADTIRAELEEARKLREEAQELRASFERKKADVKEQAQRIVAKAKADAEVAAQQARVDLEASIARRLRGAEDQIASAEAAAVREVRDSAINVAIGVAGGLIAKNLSAADAGKLIEDSIATVETRLH